MVWRNFFSGRRSNEMYAVQMAAAVWLGEGATDRRQEEKTVLLSSYIKAPGTTMYMTGVLCIQRNDENLLCFCRS